MTWAHAFSLCPFQAEGTSAPRKRRLSLVPSPRRVPEVRQRKGENQHQKCRTAQKPNPQETKVPPAAPLFLGVFNPHEPVEFDDIHSLT